MNIWRQDSNTLHLLDAVHGMVLRCWPLRPPRRPSWLEQDAIPQCANKTPIQCANDPMCKQDAIHCKQTEVKQSTQCHVSLNAHFDPASVSVHMNAYITHHISYVRKSFYPSSQDQDPYETSWRRRTCACITSIWTCVPFEYVPAYITNICVYSVCILCTYIIEDVFLIIAHVGHRYACHPMTNTRATNFYTTT